MTGRAVQAGGGGAFAETQPFSLAPESYGGNHLPKQEQKQQKHQQKQQEQQQEMQQQNQQQQQQHQQLTFLTKMGHLHRRAPTQDCVGSQVHVHSETWFLKKSLFLKHIVWST